MSKSRFSDELHRLLPEESNKRIRAAIMLAYNGSSGVARRIKNEIDQENRPRNGLLNSGILDITSPTTATLDQYAWVIDYVIFQSGLVPIDILAPEENFSRPDYFLGYFETIEGELLPKILYAPGAVDDEGNAQFPNIPDGHILLASILRNPDGTNTIDPIEPDNSDWLSKSVVGIQAIKSLLRIEPLAAPQQFSLMTDPNGLIRRVPPHRAGIYRTKEGSGGWSRSLRINIDPEKQVNYIVTMQMLGVSEDYEKGELWCVFRVNSAGNIIKNSLKLFGEFTPELFKLVRVDTATYELYFAHNRFDSLYSFRPIMLFGNDFRYEFYHLADIIPTLPAGDQFDFAIFGGLIIPEQPKFGIVFGGQVIYSGTGLRYNLTNTGYHIYTEDIILATNQFQVLVNGDPTFDRIDVLYLDINGFQKVTGIPSADPQQPSLPDPANNIFLTFILVKANATVPDTVTDIVIYDENVEFVATYIGAGTANYNNTANVVNGAKSANVTNPQANSTMVFTAPENFLISDIDTLSFFIQLKAAMNNNRNISLRFVDENDLAVTSTVNVPLIKNQTTYQLTGLSISEFQIFSNTARKLHIIYTGSSGPATFAGWFLDVLKMEAGIVQPQLPGESGLDGWSPVFATIADGERRVHQVIDWIGGEGSKPPVGLYIGMNGYVSDIANAINIRGGIGPEGYTPQKGIDYFDGDDGLNGWTASLANVIDGERIVQQVIDWFGGQGTKPTTGQYVAASGYVTNIALATNIKGAQGPAGNDFIYEAVERASNTVLFDQDYIIGNAGARTGNVLFDFTGAKLGAVTMMLHNGPAEPGIPTAGLKLKNSAIYAPGENNYIYFNLIKKSSPQVVHITISQEEV